MSDNNDLLVAPRLSERDALQISDAGLESSHTRDEAQTNSVCPYSTSRFFDQECSRYHDCPTHTIERTPAGGDDDDDGSVTIGMRSRRSSQTNATAQQAGGTLGHDADSNGSRREPDTVNGSMSRQDISSNSQSSETDERGSHVVQVADPYEGRLTLREVLDQTTGSFGGPSIGNSAPPESRADARSSRVRRTNRNGPASPLVVSSETQRPPSRLNPIAPEFTPGPNRSPQEITLPRWQPDSEVTLCPICRTQFSFFVRKHHCRKCGRVVCNACSPHRITIPHQYIVRPPSERAYQRYSFLGDEGGIADFTALGGGEQVRLCNPCVPDPNTTPPRTQHSTSQFSPRSTHHRSHSSSSGNYSGDSNLNRPQQYLVSPNSPYDAYPRSRSVTMNSGPGPSRPAGGPYFLPQNRIMTGTPPTYYPRSQPAHPRHRRTSLLGHHLSNSSFIDTASGSSSSSSTATGNRPLPPAPQIPEEDECPICHRELPSRELPNFEALRESHIESCIIAHSSYSPSSGEPGRSSQAARRTGMFPYLATEKDCVDSAECTICLEEFEVGVAMARLECLCRFHRACISAWFVDHPGRCPVHQHDSLGY
ncbi:FYVE-domain-containing protein [Daldinia grandis]|nr:FYVE-domain-containing protein [Daldinia grandis]